MEKKATFLFSMLFVILLLPVPNAAEDDLHILPLMIEIQGAQPDWQPLAMGALRLNSDTFNVSLWLDHASQCSLIVHGALSKKTQSSIEDLRSLNGLSWAAIFDISVNGCPITQIITFTFPQNFAFALGTPRTENVQREWAANDVFWNLAKLGEVSHWEFVYPPEFKTAKSEK